MEQRGYEIVATSDDDDKCSLTSSNLMSRSESKFPRSPSPTTSLKSFPKQARPRMDRRVMRLNTELIEAIVSGNLNEVKRCLDQGANSNATCRPARISSCHIASLLGHEEILSLLLDKGARLDCRDAKDRTPLHLAAWGGNLDCMKILISHATGLLNVRTKELLVKDVIPLEWLDSCDHNHRSVSNMLPTLELGSTPLHVACKRTKLICVQYLLEAGADYELKDSRNLRPLDVIGENLIEHHDKDDVEFRFPEVIRTLIKAGARHYLTKDYNLLGFKVTPLHTAIELQSKEAISALLEANFPRGTWNQNGETPMHLCILRKLAEPLKQLTNFVNEESPRNYLDLENWKGMTPLQTAVHENWILGVSIVLEAGANVAVTSRDGYTALHLAASSGNLEMMQEILSIPDAQGIVETQNQLGETPLFCAISGGNVECVEELLNSTHNLEHELYGRITVFHRAAEYGSSTILQTLLNKDVAVTRTMINLKDTLKMSGMTPLHMAAQEGHANCVRTLLDAGADILSTTSEQPHFNSTAVHLAATHNHFEVVQVLLQHNSYIVDLQDSHGWTPIHVACYHCSRECIQLLINAGADLSATTFDPVHNRRTAIDFLVHNVPRPVEFLKIIFDSAITTNEYTINEANCLVTVDYQVLAPCGRDTQQMQVINALMNTGNQFGQKQLLIHPLIESFLYLKWRALSSVFMVILALYAIFVVATTQLITGIYYYEDKGDVPPFILDTKINSYILLFSLIPISIQEILHAVQRSWYYLRELESWVKWSSFILSTIVVLTDHRSPNEWTRHVAAVAVLLAWTELMFLLSRFPEWGYYVLMFSKVATNVIKVLLTFAFLVIGFTFSFLVQFRSEPPFATPWQSLVKTMVMMTSEFDYSDLFTDQENYVVTMTLGRMVFVAFVVLAAIVLMNLMVGLAVNDIHDLEIRGKTQRLYKQVNFLCSLDLLIYNEIILRYLPANWRAKVEKGRFVDSKMYIYPGRPTRTLFKIYPPGIKDSIVQNAFKNRKNEEPTLADVVARLNDLEHLVRLTKVESLTKSERCIASLTKEYLQKNMRNIEKNISYVVEQIPSMKNNLEAKWTEPTGASQDVLESLNTLKGQLNQLRTILCRNDCEGFM